MPLQQETSEVPECRLMSLRTSERRRRSLTT